MNIMGKTLAVFCVVLSLLLFSQIVFATEPPTRVLIYSGANNHKWQETTPAIKDILTDAAISVDVIDPTGNVTAQLLSKYDVIVSDWNNYKDKSLDWPEENKQAFLDFISKGGGHVMVHAGGSSFYDWPQYHQIVASWGKQTGHGPKHEFPVNIELPDHPICRGVKSFQTRDELWQNTTFPAGSKVLMTAFSSKEFGGNDNDEPILTVSQYGSGRCVNFTLGHGADMMTNPGFKTVLIQSVLWAGDVKNATNFKWHKTDKSIALKNNDKIVWQFNFTKDASKPYFHPVALIDGTVLTEARPDDHPWHYALWFSWKKINGINFWEENRETGKSEGKTDWSGVKFATNDDHSAIIIMNLTYSHQGQRPILSEKRLMQISPPDADGVYYIDWTSVFTACSATDVLLDRTPLPGQAGGKKYGGYAGLSVRLNSKGDQWAVATEKGAINMDEDKFRGKAESMDYSGVFDGQPAGIAILDNPKNLNAPSPWYVIDNKQMKFFTPAVICYKPHKLQAGKTFNLSYRLIVHPKKWKDKNLKSQIKKYRGEK
ncbi:MAG: hypothetical protein FVQ79_12480 [Planctomycetes bacterium]|nr:hypothetical protein [Planctomycetota bacterium]